MKRFQFRLEHLLELRKYKEREWELKLAKITGVCLALGRRITEIGREINLTIQSLFEAGSIGDYSYRISRELFMTRLRQERKEKEFELEKREEERKKVQEEYLVHSRKRKVLEKLKEKQEQEYYILMKKEEFKALDDINNGLYTRKRKE
jgi:flagellar protein FliJ